MILVVPPNLGAAVTLPVAAFVPLLAAEGRRFDAVVTIDRCDDCIAWPATC